MAGKFDPKAAMRRTLAHETERLESRFAKTEEVMAGNPNGLSVAGKTPAGNKVSSAASTAAGLVFAQDASPSSVLRTDATNGLDIIEQAEDLNQVRVGKTYLIALHLVVTDNKYNARVYYPNEDIDRSAMTLSESGQQVPACGYVKGSKITLIDGQMRARGMLAAGLQHIRVEISAAPTSAKDEYLTSRRINEIRSSQTVLDDAVRWEQLLNEKVFVSAAELAKNLDKSEGYVSQVRSINLTPKELVMRMKDHQVTSGKAVACAIASIFTNPQAKEDPAMAHAIATKTIDAAIEKNLTRAAVEAFIKSQWSGPTSRVRGMARHFVYAGSQGALNVYPSKGELKLSIAGLSADDLEALREKIEATIASVGGSGAKAATQDA